MLRPTPMPHPNRSRRPDAPDRNPRFDEVRAARAAAGHTIREAARTVFVSLNAWQKWEADPAQVPPDQSTRMPASAWWLYRLATGQATLDQLRDAQAARDALDHGG